MTEDVQAICSALNCIVAELYVLRRVIEMLVPFPVESESVAQPACIHPAEAHVNWGWTANGTEEWECAKAKGGCGAHFPEEVVTT